MQKKKTVVLLRYESVFRIVAIAPPSQ